MTTESKYIRINGEGDLETAVKSFKTSNLEIVLVGNAHFGEPSYYKELTSLLISTDKVLYELVKPSDEVSLWQKLNPTYWMMNQMESVMKIMYHIFTEKLGVEHILTGIYQPFLITDPRCEWCDIDEKELYSMRHIFKSSLASLKMFPSLLLSIVLIKGLEKFKLLDETLEIVFSEEYIPDIFKTLATSSTFAFDEAIVFYRNRRVFNRLVELETEEDVHKVGVLYGAGHMPNLEHLIRSELGAELVDENWFTAWKIPRKSA